MTRIRIVLTDKLTDNIKEMILDDTQDQVTGIANYNIQLGRFSIAALEIVATFVDENNKPLYAKPDLGSSEVQETLDVHDN